MAIIARPAPDTVRFFLPCSQESLDSLPFGYRTLKAFYEPGKDSTDRARFTWWPFTFKELENLPSSHSVPALAPHFDPDTPGLCLQLSVPKVLRGHSLWHPNYTDFQNLIQGVYEALLRVWPACPHFNYWRITRLDLSVNLLCKSLKEVQEYRQQLSRLRYLGKETHSTSKKRSFLSYWSGRSKTVKFYSKGLEILGTDSVRSLKVIDATGKNSLAGEALPVLRFEVEYHREGLLSALSVKHSKDLVLPAVLDWYESLDYQTWFESYMLQFDRPGPSSTLSELHQKLASMPKPEIYNRFCTEIIDFGLDWVQANYSKSTYFYRISKLRQFGIEPAHLQSHWARCTGYELPQLRSLRELPIHAGRADSEPSDDFSILVRGYVSGSIRSLKNNLLLFEVPKCQ